MVITPRQQKLIEAVRVHGASSVEALARELGVTLQTVRRDLQKLSATGDLVRFHGGVRLAESTTQNVAYQQREILNAAGKARIAKAIAARIPNDCSLILTVGTTLHAVARELMHHKGLRVVTNDLAIARLLSSNPGSEVHVCGGVLRARDHGIVGEAAVDFIRQFRVDIALVGVAGIEPDGSLRDFDYREVKVTEAVIEHAREVWLAADHTKFGRRAMVEVARLEQLSCLFTDEPLAAPYDRMVSESGVRLEVA